jgi:hypothetical protein
VLAVQLASSLGHSSHLASCFACLGADETSFLSCCSLAQMGASLGAGESIGAFVSLISIWSFLGRVAAGLVSEHYVRQSGTPRPVFSLITQATMAAGNQHRHSTRCAALSGLGSLAARAHGAGRAASHELERPQVRDDHVRTWTGGDECICILSLYLCLVIGTLQFSPLPRDFSDIDTFNSCDFSRRLRRCATMFLG